MNPVNTLQEVLEVLQQHDLCVFYLSSMKCSVCNSIKPKIERLLTDFPTIHGISASIDDIPQIAGHFLVFTAPAVLIFKGADEIFRTARFIDFLGLEKMLNEITI